MDPKKSFKEEDKQKVVEYLNLVAKHAKFNIDTSELIEYFKLLSFMQQVLLPKIEANYFEITRVIKPQEPTKDKAE